MKKSLLLASALLAFASAGAQDIITKTNAEEIAAKVLKVGYNEIEYINPNNPEGPVYTIPASEVFTIRYQNGMRDVVTPADKILNNERRVRPPRRYPKYQGELMFGYGVSVGKASNMLNLNRLHFEMLHGVRVSPYVFAGAGLAYDHFNITVKNDPLSGEVKAGVLPVFGSVKCYLPFDEEVALSMSIDLGAAIGVRTLDGCNLYTSIGPGVNFGNRTDGVRGDLSVRFQYMGENMNAILIRLGISF